MIRVDLPFPHKLLWPNGSRGHVQAVSREKRKHKLWADGAALEAVQRCVDAIVVTPLVRVHIVVHAKPKPSKLDVAFKLTVAGFLLGPIIAPILFGIAVGCVILLGYLFGK